MKLTDRQHEIAGKLREIIFEGHVPPPVDPDPTKRGNETSWEYQIDFIETIARLLDGITTLPLPTLVKKSFKEAWNRYARLWVVESNRMVLDALDGDANLFQHIKTHPKGNSIVTRILERAKSAQPGEQVNVEDILVEEMGDDDSDSGFDPSRN